MTVTNEGNNTTEVLRNDDDNDNNHDNDTTNRSLSLMERYKKSLTLIESSPDVCVDQLRTIQTDVATLALFSDNETIDDVSTKSIPFLALEYMLATALVNIPAGPGMMTKRKSNLVQSLELWSVFLSRLEVLELLSSDETKEFHTLVESQNDILKDGDDGQDNAMSGGVGPPRLPMPNRDAKIARFKAKQQLQKEIQHLQALKERRQRFGVDDEDEMDGHDSDSLERILALAEIRIYKSEAIENWGQTLMELPMIDRMVQMETNRQSMSKHGGSGRGGSGNDHADSRSGVDDHRQRQRPPAQPLQLTHITQDAMTGQLHVRKEEIRSKVFQPGWNQPTMSLEEFGEREYQAAVEREDRQKKAEAEQQNQPRRYDQLVKDGLEDDPDLVDASAQLDREWDDFKDANPRGCGNKMANRGDKNF